MLSIILSSRVKGNKDSNLKQLLDSAAACVSDPKNIEFLIKFDTDDDEKPYRQGEKSWEVEKWLSEYPFPVGMFQWNRGEGRHSLQLDHWYLFCQHHALSKFVMIASDDFTLTRPGFDKDILSLPDEVCFVGYQPSAFYEYYAQDDKWRLPEHEVWKHNFGVCLPVMSVRTAEILQNFGHHASEDNWQTLLVILMQSRYGVNVWRQIAPFYERNKTDGTSSYAPSYNNMVIDGSRNCHNLYYFKLVEQQAKNLYLNMLAERLEV